MFLWHNKGQNMLNLVPKIKQKGFTLIELLVVIGILAVLLSIVLIAINPSKQFGQADDTKRRNDINAILNAVGAFAANNRGSLPGITDTDKDAGMICTDLVTTYISALPVDPGVNNGTEITTCNEDPALNVTGYNIKKDSSGRVTVTAPSMITPPVSVTR